MLYRALILAKNRANCELQLLMTIVIVTVPYERIYILVFLREYPLP